MWDEEVELVASLSTHGSLIQGKMSKSPEKNFSGTSENNFRQHSVCTAVRTYLTLTLSCLYKHYKDLKPKVVMHLFHLVKLLWKQTLLYLYLHILQFHFVFFLFRDSIQAGRAVLRAGPTSSSAAHSFSHSGSSSFESSSKPKESRDRKSVV